MNNFTLPSGTEITLKEMTGVEEELLINKRLLNSGEAINQVFLNCIDQIGENENPAMGAVLDLISEDRRFILVRLRQISYGDDFEFVIVCGTCGAQNLVRVDLNDLEVTQLPEEREFTFTLPKSEKKVVYQYLNGHMEKQLAALKKATMTDGMLKRIVSIEGNTPTRKNLLNMLASDRLALRKDMEVHENGMDTEILTTCIDCSSPVRSRLESEISFLHPDLT